MRKLQPGVVPTMIVIVCLASMAIAQTTKKQFKYEVGPDASVTVSNKYGPIAVHSANTKSVVVNVTLHSSKVEIDAQQTGSHVELLSHLLDGADHINAVVDYDLTVPYGTELILRSSTGPLKVEKLGADVSLEGDSASVDVRDVTGAHVHVRTIDGEVTLSDIREGHVEVTTVGGKVYLHSVNGPMVKVETTTGQISYSGELGTHGQYELHSYSGNIELMLPLNASVDMTAISQTGKVTTDFVFRNKPHTVGFFSHGQGISGFLGSGSPPVSVKTVSGDVVINKH